LGELQAGAAQRCKTALLRLFYSEIAFTAINVRQTRYSKCQRERNLRRVHDMTLRNKWRNCEKFAKPWMSSHLSEWRDLNCVISQPCDQTATWQIEEARPVLATHMRTRPRGRPRAGGVITSPTGWFWSVLMWSQQDYLRLLKTVKYFLSS